MKKDIADKWVEALRSGKYKQITHKLHTENGMCCLGILSHLAEKEDVCKSVPMPIQTGDAVITAYSYDGKYDTIPGSVQEWSGLRHKNAWFEYGNSFDTGLAKLNDEGRTFTEIADIIEANWEQL